MEKVSKNSKRIATMVTSAVLVLLMASSSFISVSSSTASTVNASGVPASVSQAGDYGDIMQYDWPQCGHDEGLTGFNPGPAPGRPDVLWKVATPGSGQVYVFNGKVFVKQGVNLLAFDAFNGSLLWNATTARGMSDVNKLDDTYLLIDHSVPAATVPEEAEAGMTGIRIADGEVVWHLPIPYASRHPGSGTYVGGHYSESMKMYFQTVYHDPSNEARIVAYDLSDPSTEPPLAWTYVCESPSHVLCSGDGKFFLGDTEGNVYALDGENGTRVWKTHRRGGLALQSASYYDGKLYTSAVSTQTVCMDGDTGEILWYYERGPRAFSAYRGAAGHGMVFETTMEVDPHGHVRAWDAETGEQIWKQPAYFRISYTTMAAADGKVYTSTCDQSAGSETAGLVMPGYEFTCFDAFTGTVLWKIRGMNLARPSIAYGNLYGISGGVLYCIGQTKPAKPWSFGLVGNVENPRVAVGQSGPSDISTPKWMYQTGGDTSSSPAVVDGKVYIGSHDRNWYCLDAYTGDKIWNFTIGYYVRSSAAVVGGRVYTGADDGYIYALDADTGGQIWKTPAGGNFPHIVFSQEYQPRSSPIVIGDRLYVGALDGNVYCLDTADGSVEWTYTTGGPIGGSPAYSNGVIYIASTDRFTYALDATTGALEWETETPLDPDEIDYGFREMWHTGTPTVAEGKVFIGGGISYGRAGGAAWTEAHINFMALNATDGAVVWRLNVSQNTQPLWSIPYFDGVIYINPGFRIEARNATNGDFIWEQWLGYQILSSVAYADDIRGPKVYTGCDIGSVYVLDARTGTPLSVYTSHGNMPSSPAIWEGKMYIGSTDGNVYCFDDSPTLSTSVWAESDKGAEMWSNETITICGQLVGNPDELVWEMESDTYVPVASELHPGLPDAEIKLSFTKPDGSDVALTTTADKHGFFDFSYSPTQVGEWGWVVYYDGEEKPWITYETAYGEWNTVNVTSPPSSEEPPSEGIPMEYIYAIVGVIAIIIIAVVAYAYMKRGKK